MRYRLRTLLILMAIGPPLLFVAWLYWGMAVWLAQGLTLGVLLLGIVLALLMVAYYAGPLPRLAKWRPKSYVGRHVRYFLTGRL